MDGGVLQPQVVMYKDSKTPRMRKRCTTNKIPAKSAAKIRWQKGVEVKSVTEQIIEGDRVRIAMISLGSLFVAALVNKCRS